MDRCFGRKLKKLEFSPIISSDCTGIPYSFEKSPAGSILIGFFFCFFLLSANGRTCITSKLLKEKKMNKNFLSSLRTTLLLFFVKPHRAEFSMCF